MNRSTGFTIAVVGASARQLVEIAHHAGIRCKAIDMFADRDTVALCQPSCESSRSLSPGSPLSGHKARIESPRTGTCVRLLPAREKNAKSRRSFPFDFLNDVSEVLISGGLERRSELLRELIKRKRLNSLSPNSWTRLQRPSQIDHCFRQASCTFEPLLTFEEFVESVYSSEQRKDVSYIVKTLDSSGGRTVRHLPGGFDKQAAQKIRDKYSNRGVVQKYIEGPCISALYCSHWRESECEVRLLGVTEQLVGQSFCHASPFQYCGSVSGYAIVHSDENQIEEVGLAIASDFRLSGVFGVDFIHNQSGVFPIDINPRFTASSEIVQRAELQGENLIELHLDAIQNTHESSTDLGAAKTNRTDKRFYGKAVLFSPFPAPIAFPEQVVESFPMSYQATQEATSIADVPVVGSVIEPAAPILTVLASGDSDAEVRLKLKETAGLIYAQFSNLAN